MRLGLLPAPGGGIRELARTGQATRLIDGYFRRYVEAFDEVVYFSYHPESLREFTDDARLLDRVRVLAPARAVSRGRRALGLARGARAELAACDVLRVFQVTGVTPLWMAAMLGRRVATPFVTTYGFAYDELSRGGFSRYLKRRVAAWGLREAAAVIATTEDLRDRASRLARRVELIPNGVDPGRFVPGARRRKADERLQVLYVGRLSEEKNVRTAIQATALAGASHVAGTAAPTITVVGSGPLEAALRAEAKELHASVEFTGVVDQRDLPARYADADVFVLPSFTEGHPKVLIEAMACGLACVASDCSGNRSLIQDGVNGLLFDATKPKELADHLVRLARDPDLAARLGAAARERAVSRYDLRALVAREIALLRDVARSRR